MARFEADNEMTIDITITIRVGSPDPDRLPELASQEHR